MESNVVNFSTKYNQTFYTIDELMKRKEFNNYSYSQIYAAANNANLISKTYDSRVRIKKDNLNELFKIIERRSKSPMSKQDWREDLTIDTFKKKLRIIMQEKNLDRDKLAPKLNITIPTITRWYNGMCLPKKHNFKLLCSVLNVEPEYFKEENEKVSAEEISSEAITTENSTGTKGQLAELLTTLRKIDYNTVDVHRWGIMIVLIQLLTILIVLTLYYWG